MVPRLYVGDLNSGDWGNCSIIASKIFGPRMIPVSKIKCGKSPSYTAAIVNSDFQSTYTVFFT